MQITVLAENKAGKGAYAAEHGLSLHIVHGEYTVLFDTGQSGLFSENALKAGTDITSVHASVLSHGHYDHAGGLPRFMELNCRARIFMKKEALIPKYSADGRFIGTDLQADKERFSFIDKQFELTEGLWIIPSIEIFDQDDTNCSGFFIDDGQDLRADMFEDELFLAAMTEEGLTVITGCSHRGITNIVHTAKRIFKSPVAAAIGGFHLKARSADEVRRKALALKKAGLKRIETGHCTGRESLRELKEVFGAGLGELFCGKKIKI